MIGKEYVLMLCCMFCVGLLVLFVFVRETNQQKAYPYVIVSNQEDSNHLIRNYSPLPNNTGLSRRYPDAIIIGAMKSGTEALLKFMSLHPDVAITDIEETDYFRQFYNYGAKNYYLKRMPLSKPGQKVIEKTTYFGNSDKCPERIHHFDPTIKLILILRNPVLRLISDLTARRALNGDLRSVEEICFDAKGNVKPYEDWFLRSNYYHHMVNWLEYYASHEILVLDGEAFVKDPVPVLEEVEYFLVLEQRLSNGKFHYNKEKGFFCYEFKEKEECIPEFKGRKHINVSNETLEKLYNYYRPLNDQLFYLLKLPFIQKWNDLNQIFT